MIRGCGIGVGRGGYCVLIEIAVAECAPVGGIAADVVGWEGIVYAFARGWFCRALPVRWFLDFDIARWIRRRHREFRIRLLVRHFKSILEYRYTHHGNTAIYTRDEVARTLVNEIIER